MRGVGRGRYCDSTFVDDGSAVHANQAAKISGSPWVLVVGLLVLLEPFLPFFFGLLRCILGERGAHGNGMRKDRANANVINFFMLGFSFGILKLKV